MTSRRFSTRVFRAPVAAFATFVAICVITLAAIDGSSLIPGKVSGGGFVVSAAGTGKANLRFNVDACDPENVTGSLTYQDKPAGVNSFSI